MFPSNTHWRNVKIFVWLNVTMFVLCLVYTRFNSTDPHTVRSDHHQTILPYNRTIVKRPVILLWTTFFGGMGWYKDSKDIFNKTSRDCVLTNNKSYIDIADAVVFHLTDIQWYGSVITGFGVPMPRRHSPRQVWVLYNLEPLPSIWFDPEHWNGIFNWTMTFKMDSDVPVPYGEFAEMSKGESESINVSYGNTGFPFYTEHPKDGGVAMISNCIDDARRFRIIDQLQKYIPIKVIGRCGDSTSDYSLRSSILPRYKFYLALENSDCHQYVSEKYWKTLERHQIPIVAWKNNMSGIVFPGSYINVFDFGDLDEAGKHIAEVNVNETLYNSYFDWMFTYRFAYQNGWCKLCDALHANTTHRYYNDVKGWLLRDTCKPVTVRFNFSTPNFNRRLCRRTGKSIKNHSLHI